MPSPPTYHNHSHFNKTIQKFIFTVKILINAQALINTHLPQFQLKKCRILGPFPKKLVPLLNAHYKKMRDEKKKNGYPTLSSQFAYLISYQRTNVHFFLSQSK